MRTFLLLVLLFTSSLSFGSELETYFSRPNFPSLQPDSVIPDPSLDTISILHFRFANVDNNVSTSIQYSVDRKANSYQLRFHQKDLQLPVKQGYHEIQFFYSNAYHDEYSWINVEKGKHYYYTVNFRSSQVLILKEIPVNYLYLYPEATTDIHAEIQPKGEFAFASPSYNNHWKITASSDGKLNCNGDSYDFLFWKTSERIASEDVDFNTGFRIEGTKAEEFLEETLSEIGFTASERADFISYWGPKMKGNSNLFLHFYFNDDCDRFGTLEISPKPEKINRVYLVWKPILQVLETPTPQKLPVLNRDGFDVLEWGGQELPTTLIRSL